MCVSPADHHLRSPHSTFCVCLIFAGANHNTLSRRLSWIQGGSTPAYHGWFLADVSEIGLQFNRYIRNSGHYLKSCSLFSASISSAVPINVWAPQDTNVRLVRRIIVWCHNSPPGRSQTAVHTGPSWEIFLRLCNLTAISAILSNLGASRLICCQKVTWKQIIRHIISGGFMPAIRDVKSGLLEISTASGEYMNWMGDWAAERLMWCSPCLVRVATDWWGS